MQKEYFAPVLYKIGTNKGWCCYFVSVDLQVLHVWTFPISTFLWLDDKYFCASSFALLVKGQALFTFETQYDLFMTHQSLRYLYPQFVYIKVVNRWVQIRTLPKLCLNKCIDCQSTAGSGVFLKSRRDDTSSDSVILFACLEAVQIAQAGRLVCATVAPLVITQIQFERSSANSCV